MINPKRYILDRIGSDEYNKFIEWAFLENPGPHKLNKVPELWKHQNIVSISSHDEVEESLDKMLDLYQLNIEFDIN